MQTIGSGLRIQLSHISKPQSRITAFQQAYRSLSHPSVRCQSTVVLRSPSSTRPSTLKQRITPFQQQLRNSSFLHDESIIPNKRQAQKTARESYFTRRRREREARSKISTLALTRDSIPFETALEAQNETTQSSTSTSSSSSQEAKDGKDQSVTPRRRRLLLLGGILLLPVIGGDLVEAVLPGLLGVIIFVAGNIKAAMKWVKSIGSGDS